MTYYMAGEGRRQFGQTTPSEMPDRLPDVGPPAGGHRGAHHPLELPDGDPLLEDDAGPHPRQHGGGQAGHGHPPVGRQPPEGARRGRPPEGRREHGERQRLEGGHAAHGPPRRRDRVVHRLDGSRPQGVFGLRAGVKHCHLEMGGKNVIMVMDDARLDLAAEGALWGGRHHGAALHGRQPRGRAPEGVRGVRRALRGGGEGPAGWQRARSEDPDGPLRQRVAARDRRELREDRQGRGGEAARGREPALLGPPRARLLPRAHESSATATRRCAWRARKSSAPWSRSIPVSSLEEAIEVGNSVDYGLSASIYTQDVNDAFAAMRDMYTGIFYVNAPRSGPRLTCPSRGPRTRATAAARPVSRPSRSFPSGRASTSTSAESSSAPRSTETDIIPHDKMPATPLDDRRREVLRALDSAPRGHRRASRLGEPLSLAAPRALPRHPAQHHGRPRGARVPRPSAHERRAGPDRRGLPGVRGLAERAPTASPG